MLEEHEMKILAVIIERHGLHRVLEALAANCAGFGGPPISDLRKRWHECARQIRLLNETQLFKDMP